MGNNNSSTLTINLARTSLFYFTDEVVSGTVALNITEGKVEADEIYIQMTGEIGYTTEKRVVRDKNGHIIMTGTITNSTDRITYETEYHHIPFYSAKAIFAQPEAGQKHVVCTEGEYLWPFEIPIDDYLPPTINQPESYPHVRYYLQVVIDKPWYKPNTKETEYITVFPKVSLLHNPQYLQTITFENHNRKDITLTGTLNKSAYVPGEIIHITFDIENPQRAVIKSIVLSMLQSYRIGQNSRGYNIFQTTLPNIMKSKDEHIKQTYDVQIPSITLPPSYQFQGGISKVAFVNNNYMLKFVVKVEGMFTNFDIDIPIVVGTEVDSDKSHQHTLNPWFIADSSNAEQSMFTDHDHDGLPSYEAATQHTK
ncbi:unnamed protein product [Adineta steineri]|uniref:Arrestin C-terminal-like domain-containing protein n=1 Tax=Adineta steineri TaxID=433720 RepID=A0A820E443_9BILA|nr:unnamed protein product [Adineta steineri]CAF4241452.1 unnamed protein product [Adineta steineri]